jgi:hypothetical protein
VGRAAENRRVEEGVQRETAAQLARVSNTGSVRAATSCFGWLRASRFASRSRPLTGLRMSYDPPCGFGGQVTCDTLFAAVSGISTCNPTNFDTSQLLPTQMPDVDIGLIWILSAIQFSLPSDLLSARDASAPNMLNIHVQPEQTQELIAQHLFANKTNRLQ